MSIGKFIDVLKARWRSAFLIFVLVIAVVAAITVTRSRQYTATASVVLDIKSLDPIAGVAMPGLPVSTYMATQIDVLKSERVALRALQALRLNENADLRRRWIQETEGNGDFLPWLAELVLNSLDVKPSRDSNVLMVGFTSPDPAFSSAMANAFVKAYVDTTLDLRIEPAKLYNSFFDVRAKELRDALEHAQGKLSAYQRNNGIIAVDEKLDIENSRLSELSSELVVLQGLARDAITRQSQAQTEADQMDEVLKSPLVSGLTGELARQEARLNELSPRLGEEHPQVRELKASMDQLKTRIQSETRRVVGSLAVNSNVNQTRVSQLRASLDQQRAKVLRLKAQRDEAAVLQRDVENAQRAYDAMLNRVHQTSIESQNTQTNVSVLKHASPPGFPSSPKVMLNTALGLVLGVLLGVGMALARELIDPRLRSDDDVMQVLKLPVLSALPVRAMRTQSGRSQVRLMKARILGALPHGKSPLAS